MPAIDHKQRVRRHLRIYGRVQGVYFRSSVAEQARRHDVDGWVRNLVDGSVEAVFEGAEPAVTQVIDFCRAGPPAARVDEVRVSNEPARGERGFVLDG